MKNVKFALCLSTALLASSAAQAQWEGNWLVGVSGGYAWSTNNDVHVSFAPVGVATVFHTGHHDNDGGFGGLLAGYQARCNSWLWGGEVAVDWLGRHGHHNFSFVDPLDDDITWTGNTHLSHNATVGLTGRLGYEVTRCFMPYIRLGAETSRQRLTIDVANDDVPPTVLSLEGSRHAWRFIGGLGAEMPIPALMGLSFRAEWNYHSKGKGISGTGVVNNTTVVTADAKTGANTLKASLVWNFI